MARWRIVFVAGPIRVGGFRLCASQVWRVVPDVERATLFRREHTARAAADGCALAPHEYHVERVMVRTVPR